MEIPKSKKIIRQSTLFKKLSPKKTKVKKGYASYEELDSVKPEEPKVENFTSSSPDSFQVSIISPPASPSASVATSQRVRPGPCLVPANPKKQTLPLPGNDKEKRKERSKSLGKRYSAPLINVVEYSQ